MAEWSGFFDAHKIGESWDRTYLAEDFAKFFAPLIGNGVFAGRSNELQVFQAVPAGMSVVLSSGQSWIEGYGYTNDSDLIIPIDPADGALGRIDRIVNQWSAVDRQIRTIWKKGTPAVNPVAPPLRWDADYKELNLCTLDISAGLAAITQDKIKDTRADSSVCGWVTGLIDQVDTSTLFAQWETAYEKEFTEQKRAWEEFFGDIQLDLGIPVPSPDKEKHVLSVDSSGRYILSDEYASKEYANSRNSYNYVHNSDFTQFVAQAGVGGLHGTQAYAGDRWILDSGTVTGTKNADGNGYRNITLNGTIRQIIANPPAVGTAGVEMTSGTATVSYTEGELTITSSGGIIKHVLLCAADTLPEYQPKGYGAELAECQIYYQRSYESTPKTGGSGPIMIFLAASSYAGGSVLFPSEMRVTPTVTLYNPDTGNSGVVCDWSNSADVAASPSATSKGFQVRGGGRFTQGKYYGCHYEANADL